MTFPVFSAGTSAYNLTRSLRFRSSASAYLKRTPSASSNQQTWTWSGWVKRGALGSSQQIFASDNSSSSQLRVHFLSSDAIEFWSFMGAVQIQLITTQVFRDPSAWYHIVFKLDTTNATAANRCIVYINGVQVTAFGTATYPAQNANGAVNGNFPYYLGTYFNATAGEFLDGYLAEVNFIDGQALTPSSFGSTNSTTGVWQPARYTGTYGTNGFYLPFTDNSALTTSSNAGLGKDFSGNANYFATNNISITAGSTYDSMTDVPTLTSATAANYCTLSPLWSVNNNGYLKDGNLNVTNNANDAATKVYGGTVAVSSGKYYFESTIPSTPTGSIGTTVGVTNLQWTTEPSASYRWDLYYNSTAFEFHQPSGNTSLTGTPTSGDVLQIAIDATNGKMWVGRNNTWFSGDPSTGTTPSSTSLVLGTLAGGYSPLCVAFCNTGGGNSTGFNLNFGQRPFSYTPPSGFVALNTYNLPASTVPNGASYMAATLYTGTGATQTITNTVGSVSFTPDFVWLKARSTANSHLLADIVRGSTKVLLSNDTAAEITDANYTTFVSGGFSVSGTGNEINNSGKAYVAWNWKAGGTAVSNTNGTITSSVSVNTTSGCSVVTYTGTGVAGTIGHGLGVAPSIIIVKSRSAVGAWPAYHTSLGNGSNLVLNTTAASASSATIWNATSPTSSVFSVGINTDSNTITVTYVAYCFTPIKGFSAFGSYTGNGSTDGPFVYLGFRPRYLMLKITTTAGYYWMIKDASRDPYNTTSHELYANVNDAEYTASSYQLDFLSNGFKIKSAGQALNGSGDTYIYMAFAENPFQNSLAR